jgi:hypothetical protein
LQKTPCGVVGLLRTALGRLWPSQKEEKGEGKWAAPRDREESSLSIFFLFLVLLFLFSKVKIQICFEFCLKLKFIEEI